MLPPRYRLSVQDALEERQMRRLGAAVCLVWSKLTPDVRAMLLDEAASIEISGEPVESVDLRAKIEAFVTNGDLRGR